MGIRRGLWSCHLLAATCVRRCPSTHMSASSRSAVVSSSAMKASIRLSSSKVIMPLPSTLFTRDPDHKSAQASAPEATPLACQRHMRVQGS